MRKKMFYNASALIFSRAKELRMNLTDAELKLWEYLRAKPKGFTFRRQHPIGIYVADFFCYKLKLVIEVDGPIHEEEEVIKNDKERQKALKNEGLASIRFTNDEIMNDLQEVIKKIEALLQ